MRGNAWEEIGVVKAVTGMTIPGGGGTIFNALRGCSNPVFANTIEDHTGYSAYETGPNGFLLVKPGYYYRYHGWIPRKTISNSGQIRAVFGQTWMRLVVDDPTKPDDRSSAHFVAHVGGDISLNGTYVSGTSTSRYKEIVNDWQPINMLTLIPKADLEAHPPPFTTLPADP